LKDARHVLEVVARACTVRSTEFKFASDTFIHRKLLSKSIARQSGGKFVTIYPPDTGTFEVLLEVLYQQLKGVRGPYILSDRQYKDSDAVFYRYGGFRSFTVQEVTGREKSMILDDTFRLVEDQRLPRFQVPEFVTDGKWGQVEAASQASIGAESLFGDKYKIESALKFSNAGGVYAGSRIEDGLAVVIKESRPFVDAEANGVEPLSRLRKEQRILRALEGTGIAPRPLGWFVEWEHTFLVQEKIEGKTLREYCLEATRSLYPGSTREQVRVWIQKSAAIGFQLIKMLQVLHGHGIIFGDISTNNIIITPQTNQVCLIDFEGALQKGVDEDINLYTPGFCASGRRERDDARVSDDTYALGCVLLSLFLPVSASLDILHKYADRALDELENDVGLPRQIGTCIRELLRNSDVDLDDCVKLLEEADLSAVMDFTLEPVSSPRNDLSEVVTRSMDYMREILDMEHSWRPLPLGAQSVDLVSLDHGLSGVALVWHQVEGGLPEELKTWMRQAGARGGHLPGLVNGLCGAAWAQCEIGLLAESERLLSRAAAHPLLHDNMSLGFGYSGYGLACLKLWCTTSDRKLLKEACRVGDALLETFVRKEHGVAWTLDSLGHAGVGLHTGASGVALFLLYLAAATKDNRYLDLAMEGLDHDIAEGRALGDVLGFPASTAPDNRVLYPYLASGTAGVASVALRAYLLTGEVRYKEFLDATKASVAQKYTASPELFLGLAGIGHHLLDVAQLLNDDSYRRLAWRAARGLSFFEVERPAGTCFPSGTSVKISCSLADGGAGVISYLDRLLHDKRNGILMLDELLINVELEK